MRQIGKKKKTKFFLLSYSDGFSGSFFFPTNTMLFQNASFMNLWSVETVSLLVYFFNAFFIIIIIITCS